MQVVEVRVLSWAPRVIEFRSGNPLLKSTRHVLRRYTRVIHATCYWRRRTNQTKHPLRTQAEVRRRVLLLQTHSSRTEASLSQCRSLHQEKLGNESQRAAERAIEHASRDDALWLRLAPLGRQEPIGSCALHPTGATTSLLAKLLNQRLAIASEAHAGPVEDAGPLLSEVTEDYLRHHRKGQAPTFVNVTQSAR
jgi:hypothetical protein